MSLIDWGISVGATVPDTVSGVLLIDSDTGKLPGVRYSKFDKFTTAPKVFIDEGVKFINLVRNDRGHVHLKDDTPDSRKALTIVAYWITDTMRAPFPLAVARIRAWYPEWTPMC